MTLRALLAILSCLILAACGGHSGFPPQINAVRVVSLQYGQTATLLVGGRDLRFSVQVDSGGACTNPSYGSNSTPEVLELQCRVAATGDMALTFKAANGDLLYQTRLNVPTPQVSLLTNQGSLTLELNPVAAPISVNNFLQYVNQGFYKDTLFHRVINGFVVQGGGYTTGMTKKTGQNPPIVLESNKGLSNLTGTLAMARTPEPNSGTSEFFINLVDNTSLDYQNASQPGYAVFGSVVEGMDVVNTIAQKATQTLNGFADVPVQDIVILSARQIR